MYILGIETTAHTFGAGVIKIKNKKKQIKKTDIAILSNERSMYKNPEGGIIPSQLAEHHAKEFLPVIKSALEKSKTTLQNISLIAVSNAPGIGHALRIGVFIAKLISKKYNIPIVPVNHCIAHLEIGRVLTQAKDPVLTYVSGANTQIIAYEGKRYRIFGETLDIGIGNFLDSVGRIFSLGFPAGPKIEELAKKGKTFIELPYVIKGMDMSFGGILTNVKQKYSKGYSKEDLAYSIQETVFSIIVEATERALAHCNKKEIILGGGVACNKRLQEMIKIMAQERNAKAYFLENQFYIDNPVMIAITGYLMYVNANKQKKKDFIPEKIKVLPYQRTDEVEVYWRN